MMVLVVVLVVVGDWRGVWGREGRGGEGLHHASGRENLEKSLGMCDNMSCLAPLRRLSFGNDRLLPPGCVIFLFRVCVCFFSSSFFVVFF